MDQIEDLFIRDMKPILDQGRLGEVAYALRCEDEADSKRKRELYGKAFECKVINQIRHIMPRSIGDRASREDVIRFASFLSDRELLRRRNFGPKTVAWIRSEADRLAQAVAVSTSESFY